MVTPLCAVSRPAKLLCPSYSRTRPEETDLYRIVQENLETLYAMSEAGEGPVLPKFVRAELDGFLDCGLLSRGFAHLQCERCKRVHLVAFACKGRGFCPSCMGRRMAERAANMVDDVLPSAPLRHWVLSLPHPLRVALAYDRTLMTRVAGLFGKTVVAHYRRSARRQGARGEGGAVLVIQRTSSDLKLNPHFHLCSLDGVFIDVDAAAQFVPALGIDDHDVAEVLHAFKVKLRRVLEKAGRLGDDGKLTERLGAEDDDALHALSQCAATGALPAGPEERHGSMPETRRLLRVRDKGPLCVEDDGLSLHARTVIDASDELGRERLLKYMLRPPLATPRIRELPSGLVRIELKKTFSDGTYAVDLDPVSLLTRLAAAVPPPRMHTIRYAGVLASRSKWRARVLRVPTHPPVPGKPATHRRRYIPWAELRRRTFGQNVELCPEPDCGGRLKLRALIKDPASIRRFLKHLGEPTDPPVRAPARGPPWWRSTILRLKYSTNLDLFAS